MPCLRPAPEPEPEHSSHSAPPSFSQGQFDMLHCSRDFVFVNPLKCHSVVSLTKCHGAPDRKPTLTNKYRQTFPDRILQKLLGGTIPNSLKLASISQALHQHSRFLFFPTGRMLVISSLGTLATQVRDIVADVLVSSTSEDENGKRKSICEV